MTSKTIIRKILGWIVTISLPLIILMVSIRILITPIFAQIEYRLPGFPEDPYGFSMEERLRWATPSINYLVNSQDISYLENLTFEDGQPIYNERELSHMQDVKIVVTGMRIALAVMTVTVMVITLVAVKGGWKQAVLNAYRRGGWAIIGLIFAILLFVVLNFNQLFYWFHQLFFVSGTWQFFTSDTLIRLFPMRFWQDAFIFVGLLSAILGGIVVFLTRDSKA